MMILIITGSAGAFVTGDGKGFYGEDRQPGIKANDPFVKASTTLSDREAVPEGLTKAEWKKIRASIERDRYRLRKDDRTGEYQAPNYAHDLHATFTSEGCTSPMAWRSRPDCREMASVTLGCACPTFTTPNPPPRSTKRLPSTSQTLAPEARSQKIGAIGARQVTFRLSGLARRTASSLERGPGTALTSFGGDVFP